MSDSLSGILTCFESSLNICSGLCVSGLIGCSGQLINAITVYGVPGSSPGELQPLSVSEGVSTPCKQESIETK